MFLILKVSKIISIRGFFFDFLVNFAIETKEDCPRDSISA